MPRKTELYLYDGQREIFKKDITSIKELFFERIYPLFANAEKEAEEYENNLLSNQMEQPYYGENDMIDPADFVSNIQAEGLRKYNMLTLMQYRTIGMWISCMCQVWEQQLFAFIIQEVHHNLKVYSEADIGRGFAFSKDVFKYHNQPFEHMASWGKLKELRHLFNVLKHAEGYSEKSLREIRPDYFINSHGMGDMDLLKLYKSTLLEPTIHISTDDFTVYYNAIINFWDELPKSMISSVEI
ncbi:MAG: hypothetical protein LLF96_01100 [Eubacteriales bacterium]|nr:hypothetical protein [Eubacteriales bacterium]